MIVVLAVALLALVAFAIVQIRRLDDAADLLRASAIRLRERTSEDARSPKPHG